MEIKKEQSRVSFGIAQPSYVRPNIVESKLNGGFQSYGVDNKYPDYLLNIYFGSSQHQGIIQRKVDEILGDELISTSGNGDLKAFIKKCNGRGQSLADVLRKCVNDEKITGGFALQVIWGKGSTAEKPVVAEFYYVDITKLRWNADYTKLLYAREWGIGRVKTIKFEPYNLNDPTGTQIYYYSGTMTRGWYPIPEYIGSIPAIETAIDIANFNQNTLRNGFFPSVSITFFNGEPTEDEKAGIERMIKEKWGGTSNTGKFMLSFADKDGQGPAVEAIQQPNLDKLFADLKISVIQDIFIGHRITNPAIFGLEVAGKLGGSAEYTQSYAIFQNVYVRPQRKIILNVFNQLLAPIMPNADLDVKEVEPINNVFTDEALIASQMTQSELRTLIQKWGYIETVELPEGENAIIDTPAAPTGAAGEDETEGEETDKTPSPGAAEPEVKITKPTVKI